MRKLKTAGVVNLAGLVILPLAFAGCSRAPQGPPQETQLARAVAAPERLDPPADLPEPARGILRHRMASHARDMADLMSAIMILKYELIRERAQAIANDANFSRPLTGDANELNALLPERFFELQDEMKAHSQALAAAAERMHAFEVAEAYGKVSETCVRCHATYRAGR